MIKYAAIADIVGIIGVIFVLGAYLVLNTNRTTAHSLNYQLVNFIGSWCILFSLFFSWNLACALIEMAWIVISMIGIYRAIRIHNQ